MAINKAKFSCINYGDIQDYINQGLIDINDIVYTKDTHENLLIGTDLSVNPIRSKIYRFIDTASAEKELNIATDSYEGQIVAILEDGAYTAYIVNRNKQGAFYVTRLMSDAEIDYNTLGNRPIENLKGNLSSPIVVSGLSTGVYKVTGQYKICADDITTYIAGNGHIFVVEQTDTATIVKKITASEIYDYTVVDGAVASKAVTASQEWVKEQDYATKSYVDAQLDALDYATKEYIAEYVTNVIETDLKPYIDGRIEIKISESFKDVDEADINKMF